MKYMRADIQKQKQKQKNFNFHKKKEEKINSTNYSALLSLAPVGECNYYLSPRTWHTNRLREKETVM